MNNTVNDISKIAVMLLEEQISGTDAALSLVPLLAEIDQDNNDDFIVFKAIYSELDGFPNSDNRSLWNGSFLEKIDNEVKEIELFYKPAVLESANKLITFCNHNK